MDLGDRASVHAALGDSSRLRMVDALLVGDHTFQELASVAGLSDNLAAHHLKVLESAGLIVRRESDGDRRRRYISLQHERLDQAVVSTPTIEPVFVLFVCTHNSARSQFAAELWRTRVGGAADSAGTQPSAWVHPRAVQVASDFGLDLSAAVPKAIDAVVGAPDLVVSVCDRAHESQPSFACATAHWSIPDPVADGRPAAFRSAFSNIAARIDRLAAARPQ